MPEYNIQELFEKCLSRKPSSINEDVENSINIVVDLGEKQKGVLTVIITGLVYKYYHPEQDVRQHQSTLPNGYSGRTFDTKYITPFLRDNNFPHMAESGWLTRSLEQKLPYDMGYTGSISGRGLKSAFLTIYQATETESVFDISTLLLKKLVIKRNETRLSLSVPANLTVSETLSLIKNHINFQYKNVSGASRLPSLAIYSAYKGSDKTLCDLDAHTASDRSTKSIGDIQINTIHGRPFEGLEIKAREIEASMIDIAYSKIQEHGSVERYYILSTIENIPDKVMKNVNHKINAIRSKHGCEVIVNGVFTTLNYFLRLTDSQTFLRFYVDLLNRDDALKYEHKDAWNILCSNL